MSAKSHTELAAILYYSDKKNPWPCQRCLGDGKHVADYERPDPIEGYKLADRQICKECMGTGSKGEDWYKKEFKALKEIHKQNLTEWKYYANIWKNKFKPIFSKLKKEEKKAWEIFGDKGPL